MEDSGVKLGTVDLHNGRKKVMGLTQVYSQTAAVSRRGRGEEQGSLKLAACLWQAEVPRYLGSNSSVSTHWGILLR